MLQSYTQRDKDRASVIPSRPQSRLGQNGGHISTSGTIRSTRSEIHANKDYAHTNGRATIATVTSAFTEISGGATPQNGIIQGEVHVENHAYNERGVDAIGIEPVKTLRRSKTPERKETETVRRTSEQSESSSSSASASSKLRNVPSRQEVQRSSSSSSRKEWREQMRKKHLPPIFVNEAFDGEDHKVVTERREEARRALYQASSTNTNNKSLHYYMSSDYHPDYLTESLPRHKLTISTESDSTGVNEPYNDNDISDILDTPLENSSSLRRSSKRIKEDDIDIENIKPMPIIQRPYLSTFMTPTTVEREDSFGSGSITGSDSSRMQSGLREDREIIFDSGTIPLDDINDGFGFETATTRFTSNKNSTREIISSVRVESPKPTSKPQKAVYMEQLSTRAKSPIYDNVGVIETSTSFAKQNNESQSLASTGSFTVSHINSSQSDTDSYTITPRASKYSASDSVNNADDELNESSGSNSSVTLSPYKEETRRRPWMENLDEDNDILTLQMQEPLVHDSDTDTLKGSHDSFEQRFNFPYDSRESDVSTPVSSLFDDETDRGFEEALKAHINPAMSGYSGIGLCFESIKEEPEDLTSSGSNPFLDDLSNGNEQFKTQAVVSKRSDSANSSSTSISDNPFLPSPAHSPPRGNAYHKGHNTPTIITTDAEFDMGDSGFTSAIDHINTSDSSNQHDPNRSGKLSPWPDSDENIKEADLSFESDFSENSNIENAGKNEILFKSLSARKGHIFTESPGGVVSSNKSAKVIEIVEGHVRPKTAKPAKPPKPVRSPMPHNKPHNVSVQEIRSHERRAPARAKSFEETSPSKKATVTRSGSMDEPRSYVKPAYF